MSAKFDLGQNSELLTQYSGLNKQFFWEGVQQICQGQDYVDGNDDQRVMFQSFPS